ncbi:type 1 glutamine amidotransferase family protein [Guptibacillus algicola]|uniref:type 1 glutamine amidotransferase family protein n=1 Tax=Guptibacillus algicola TaxID=225844 RepID=UPI001CD19C5D|nr:type 1 glutamine amidotransferase family protein [Alkalihalobacillus algicola]MCA0987356.1 glutamine amidotransferase [Alkalihalobacillus algicola]
MKTVLVFITDGFADWEASYVTPELNKAGTGYHVKTIAIDNEPKRSMGGLTVLPDYSLQEFPSALDLAMLIIPGGTGWREEKNHQAKKVVDYCLGKNIPVAAICDATTFLGENGFLDEHKHTGNTLAYLQEGAPHYRGEEHYLNEQSVSDGCLITANGSATLEFSRDILRKLNVLEGKELNEWYDIFKNGYIKS